MKPPVLRFEAVPSDWIDELEAHSDPDYLPAWASERLREWELPRFKRHRSPEARAAYVAAHDLARRLLGQAAGAPTEFAQACSGCAATDHGAPYVVGPQGQRRGDLYVSLSHSGRFVAASVAVVPCGVDVQVVGRVPDRALTAAEVEWAGGDLLRRNRLWARKEALVKTGAHELGEMATLTLIEDPRVTDWPGITGADGELAVVGAWALLSPS